MIPWFALNDHGGGDGPPPAADPLPPPAVRLRTTRNTEFALLYPSLRRFAAAVCSGDIDPDDVVQEALVRALHSREFAAVERRVPYLRRAIVNIDLEHRRRQGARRAAQRRVADEAPDGTVEARYPSDLALLGELRSVDRAILFLADVEGHPAARVAEQLGLSESAVRLRASRARRQLRRTIAREERR